MIRAAVIGVGRMGRNHARVYHEMTETDLVGVADLDERKLGELSHLYGVPAYLNYRAMLHYGQPDVVSVAVPTDMHFRVAMAALLHGCHVLVEKPITLTVGEGQCLIERAAEKGLVLAVGHIERYNPAVIEMKRWLEEGGLGCIFQIHTRRLGPFPTWVHDTGVVLDLAIHDLDIMRYLIGEEVQRVYAEIDQEIHLVHEDLLSGLLRFEGGVVGVLNANWLTPTKVREVTVTTQRGLLLANLLTQDLYLYKNKEADDLDWQHLSLLRGVGEGEVIRLCLKRREPLRTELEAFVAAVQGKEAAIVHGTDGLAALRLAQLLIQSGQERRMIEC